MPELQMSRKEGVDMRKALSIFKHQTEYVPDMDRPPAELPAEVLSEVFDELALLTPPPYEHNPDVILGPRSPFMDHARFQKGLTLVCKKWWEPATRALYHRIVIRHMGQISALARTLSATNAGYDFSSSVKHIALHQCAILKPFSNVVLEDLRVVLRCCRTLQSFSMVPHFSYGSGLWQWLGSPVDDGWMALGCVRSVLPEGFAKNLRHLEFPLATDSPAAVVGLYHILSQTTQLFSLRLVPLYLKIMDDEPYIMLSTTLQMLSLPALSELQFSTRCRDFTDWATSSLQLPNLTSLTLIDYDGHIPLPFLAAHGGRLTYLHCYPPEKSPDTWHVSSVQFGFDELSDVAPMIEHLIVCTQSVPHLLRDLSQGERSLLHLRYLDVWMRLPGLTRQRVLEESFKEYDAATGANKEKFPALGEHIRFLSYHGHSDLPKICHPSALSADDEIRALCIRDICVVQTSWCVRANEDFVELDEGLNSATAASDDEEDPEFVPEDDGEDRTSWISEDASDVGSDAGSSDDGGEESFVTLSEGEGLEELPNGLYTLPHRALLEQY